MLFLKSGATNPVWGSLGSDYHRDHRCLFPPHFFLALLIALGISEAHSA